MKSEEKTILFCIVLTNLLYISIKLNDQFPKYIKWWRNKISFSFEVLIHLWIDFFLSAWLWNWDFNYFIYCHEIFSPRVGITFKGLLLFLLWLFSLSQQHNNWNSSAFSFSSPDQCLVQRVLRVRANIRNDLRRLLVILSTCLTTSLSKGGNKPMNDPLRAGTVCATQKQQLTGYFPIRKIVQLLFLYSK